MAGLHDLTADRKKLIMHRITRAVYERLQREDVTALYAFSYLGATIHRIHNETLGPEELREAINTSTDMLVALLTCIQNRCKFDWATVVSEILQEEGVPVPTPTDISDIAILFVGRAVA